MKYICFIFLVFFHFLFSGVPLYATFKLGIEQKELIQKNILPTERVALIANQTSRNLAHERSVDLLRSYGCNIVAIFAPEHGFEGEILAGHKVSDTIDQKTQLPIYSLYTKETGHNSIAPDKLKEVDTLIFDLQDCGMRHYTYISTLYRLLEAGAAHNKKIVVLDRPNPLGGVMEGPLVESQLTSFISIAPVPLRHGMTVGELASYFNTQLLPKPAHLVVIPMKDYNRFTTPFTFIRELSPNLKSLEALYGYSFLGLLGEVAPFYTGVGTPDAFQLIMLPLENSVTRADWRAVQHILQNHQVESSYLTKARAPGRVYEGLKLTFKNINRTSSFKLLLQLLQFFGQKGVKLQFNQYFDKAVGTSQVKELFEQKQSINGYLSQIYAALENFYSKADRSFLYIPYPVIFR